MVRRVYSFIDNLEFKLNVILDSRRTKVAGHLYLASLCTQLLYLLLHIKMLYAQLCDQTVRNESNVGSLQVEKMGNMHAMGG